MDGVFKVPFPRKPLMGSHYKTPSCHTKHDYSKINFAQRVIAARLAYKKA